jgi:hypothetical protein
MRTVICVALLAALAASTGCAERAAPVDPAAPEVAAPSDPPAAPDPAVAPGDTGGSLRVDAPAPGTITFQGFGPAAFGGSEEDVRMAWGGDLGNEFPPEEPNGCHYLIPQPVGAGGYRTAFMLEGGKFVRIDVRRDDVAAPGGGKVGMTKAQIEGLYPGRVEERPHKYSDGLYLRITDAAGGPGVLVFETDAKGDAAKVDEWRVGLPPQVDYVEGCS